MEYIEIDGIFISDEILRTKFSCDYEKCHGACCNEELPNEQLAGGSLTNEEASEIEHNKKYLECFVEARNHHALRMNPVERIDGKAYTPLDCHSACIFSNSERKMCSLILAKVGKILKNGIPLSCSLYPIVMETEDDGTIFLEMSHLFDEFCEEAYKKGEEYGTTLTSFCSTPLIRAFGKEWYEKLKKIQDNY